MNDQMSQGADQEDYVVMTGGIIIKNQDIESEMWLLLRCIFWASTKKNGWSFGKIIYFRTIV
jgi:hypothetical protein